jgi:activator of HSP90 ATPase
VAAVDNSPLNTSGSSLTEEIFNNALSNLEFLSDEEHEEMQMKRKGSTTGHGQVSQPKEASLESA